MAGRGKGCVSMTVQDLITLLPDSLLKALSSEEGDNIDEAVLEKFLTQAENLAAALSIKKDAMKEEFVLHYVLAMLYERYGLFDQARAHQQYIQTLLQNFKEYTSTEDLPIKFASKSKIIDENDPRNWWWL